MIELSHAKLLLRPYGIPGPGPQVMINIPPIWGQLQVSAVTTWANLSWYYTQHCNDSRRTKMIVQTHNRHSIPNPQGWTWGCHYDFEKKPMHFKSIALYCGNKKCVYHFTFMPWWTGIGTSMQKCSCVLIYVRNIKNITLFMMRLKYSGIEVYAIAVDALAPCVTRSWATMVLIMCDMVFLSYFFWLNISTTSTA